MDVFAEHGMAGVVGLVFNGLFAADYIIGLDGVNTGLVNGGWLNYNYKLLYIQVAYIVACTGYAFTMSTLLASIINIIPGLHLRASEDAELLGMDDDQLGEFAYDYVEVRRDYLAWTPAKDEPERQEMNISPQDRHGITEHSDIITGHFPQIPIDDSQHTRIQGDNHGSAAGDTEKENEMEKEKERIGVVNDNGNDST